MITTNVSGNNQLYTGAIEPIVIVTFSQYKTLSLSLFCLNVNKIRIMQSCPEQTFFFFLSISLLLTGTRFAGVSGVGMSLTFLVSIALDESSS